MSSIPPSPSSGVMTLVQQRMDWGDNALAAPTTPERRLPVVDKSKVDPTTLKAAQGMEAMFLDYMMKSMRQTISHSEMSLENKGTEVYRNMLDSEMAQRAARTGGIGLADQIVAYLESQRYTLTQGPKSSAQSQGGSASPVSGKSTTLVESGLRPNSQINDRRSTGGTHEGQPIRE